MSILLVCTAGGPALEGSLRSALDQSYRNLEILIVDCCAERHQLRDSPAASDHGPRIIVVDEIVEDRWSAFLYAYQQSTGSLVKPLLAGDLLHATAITRLVAAVRCDPAITLATSRRVYLDGEGAPLPETTETAGIDSVDVTVRGTDFGNQLLLTMVNYLCDTSTLMWHRDDMPPTDDLFRIGGQHPQEHVAELWLLKLMALGKIAFLAEPRVEIPLREKASGIEQIDSWLHLIEGSKALGYLADPALERDALSALVRQTVLDPTYLDTENHGQTEEVVGRWTATLDRIGTLVDTVFAEPAVG